MAQQTDKTVRAAGDLVAAVQKAGKGAGPAPVHLWNPPYCGEMDLEIRADGSWWHEGTPIGRPALVRLFANILKREGDRHFLVTPVEKLGIRVADAPFIAVDADAHDGAITFTTNLGDTVAADADHAITLRDGRPYLHVRGGLEALIDRKTFYRLAEMAEPGPDGRMAVASGGVTFALEA